MGGDFAPEAVVCGAIMAQEELSSDDSRSAYLVGCSVFVGLFDRLGDLRCRINCCVTFAVVGYFGGL